MGQDVSSTGEATLGLGPPLPTTDSTVPLEPQGMLSRLAAHVLAARCIVS